MKRARRSWDATFERERGDFGAAFAAVQRGREMFARPEVFGRFSFTEQHAVYCLCVGDYSGAYTAIREMSRSGGALTSLIFRKTMYHAAVTRERFDDAQISVDDLLRECEHSDLVDIRNELSYFKARELVICDRWTEARDLVVPLCNEPFMRATKNGLHYEISVFASLALGSWAAFRTGEGRVARVLAEKPGPCTKTHGMSSILSPDSSTTIGISPGSRTRGRRNWRNSRSMS